MRILKFQRIFAMLFTVVASIAGSAAAETKPVLIGLDADMSAVAARGGVAIQRGAEIAIEEINARGGVLGRPLQLVIKDHRGNPVRGADNIRSFAAMREVVAVLGGVHTPVALHELETIHQNQMIYFSPWAAGTPVVDNGYKPNYVFRVSVRDEFAGPFLVREALSRGYQKIGLALEKTGWGRSNEKAMKSALAAEGLQPTAIAWFNWGQKDMEAAVDTLVKSGTKIVLLVANAPEGLTFSKSIATRPKESRFPIISHWGITGGKFFEQAKDFLDEIDLSVLQTYSFANPPFPQRADKVIAAYLKRYDDATSANDIFAPTGTAHAYDIVQILALAIEQSGTTDRTVVRDTLESLNQYRGLLRDYSPPFSASRHDALDAGDFNISRYNANGVMVPWR